MTQALLDQAIALHGQGRLDEAETLYARILVEQPSHLPARHMLGVAYAQQGRNEEALALLDAVVAADPRDALALTNRGNVLNALGRAGAALASFDRSLALEPLSAEAWNGRTEALRQLSRPAAALESVDRALLLNPDLVAALAQRPNLLHVLGRHREAVEAYDRVLAVVPNDADFLTNRGLALQNLGRLREAGEDFRRSVALAPGLAVAQLNLGLWHLLQQDFARGLPLFEWRKHLPSPMENRVYPQPLWTGAEDLTGKTLFAYIEQGLGDTIQFYRYLAPVLARGARVVLSVHDSMIALMRDALPAVELIGWNKTPAEFDFHIPLMSLPLALGMRAIDPVDRYLFAQPQRVRDWKARLGDHGFRIGIAWQGNMAVPGSEGKSFPLAALAGIAALPGVRLINLQKNAGAEQLANLPSSIAVEQFAFDEGKDAFLDTAAIMENCDLVISADSAPAHLAGALDVPCWVALKHVPDWRFFLTGSDCPWYGSLRLFRQPAPGDWAAPLAEMQAAIAATRSP